DEYGRRPGPLLDRLEAIIRGPGLGRVARAQIDLGAATLRIAFTAHLAAVDGGRWLLDGAHVVERVAAGSKEIRIGEMHVASGIIGRAGKGQPRTFDQAAHRLVKRVLWMNADHFDTGNLTPPGR